MSYESRPNAKISSPIKIGKTLVLDNVKEGCVYKFTLSVYDGETEKPTGEKNLRVTYEIISEEDKNKKELMVEKPVIVNNRNSVEVEDDNLLKEKIGENKNGPLGNDTAEKEFKKIKISENNKKTVVKDYETKREFFIDDKRKSCKCS